MAKKKNKDNSKTIRTAWKIFAGVWIFIFLFFTLLSLGWLGFMPSFEELENPQSNQATEVISADGATADFAYDGTSPVSFRVTYDASRPGALSAILVRPVAP